MKKNKLSANLFCLAMASILLIGCDKGNQKGLSSKNKENIEALTSITFLESAVGINHNSISKRKMINSGSQMYDEVKLQSILPTLDTLMNNGTTVKSNVEEVNTVINEITYSFKETLTFKDHNLEDASYTLIYNKNIGKEEIDEKSEKTESSELLSGYVVLTEEIKYPFESKSSTEQEKDEREEERYFHITIDENSYVLVEEENEIETNETETEFSYTFVKNGKVELEYSISIETEKDQFDEISYELDGIEYELKKVLNNGEELYKIEIENNNNEEVVVFYKKDVSEDGTTTFVKVEK